MNEREPNEEIPFSPGDWVIDRSNPAQPGQYTGNWRRAGPFLMVQLSYPGGGASYRPLDSLQSRSTTTTLAQRLQAGHFGKVRDLQRLITYEKIKGTLHEVIYSNRPPKKPPPTLAAWRTEALWGRPPHKAWRSRRLASPETCK